MTGPASRPSRPELEPLSDIAWARVERRLWTELDQAPTAEAVGVAPPPRGRWPWLAAVAAVAAAAIVVVLAWPSAHRRPGPALASRVVTASAATAVSFGDAAIEVGPESALMMEGQPERGVTIVLERGRATFAVAPRAGRPPFVIHAGAVQVRVIGTRFTVTRSGDDARVDVAHGEVEVVAWGRREVLLAGATWFSGDDREAVDGDPDAITTSGGGAAAHSSPSAPLTVPPPPHAVDPVPPALDPRHRAYDDAAGLERRDPDGAMRAYKQLAAGTDRWAANALYAGARLAWVRHDDAVAVRFARAYLTRFPRGRNAGEARAIRDGTALRP